MPQSAAALRWLSTAPSPHASTAAIQRPRASSVSLADGIDAAVQAMQATRARPVSRLLLREPRLEQLTKSNDAVLLRRKPGD